MQSSKRLHFDEKVSMRRLRPLYDLVDAGQNKKAISEADRILKKHPKLHTANALKALSFIRIERFVDAEALIDTLEDICKNEDVDEPFVQALSHCYKELNRPDRIVDMYTELIRRQPTYEPFMRELFFANTRCANLKEQQRVALQLAKICTTTEPSTYYIWAVLVILVQGFQNKQLGVSMSFPLANRMLEKVKDEELIQHQGGLELRLTALEAVGKYAEAIQLIRLHFGDQLQQHQSKLSMRILQRLRRLYQLGGCHAELFQLCMDSVDNNDPNDWSNWALMIDSFFHLQDTDGSLLSVMLQKCHFLADQSDRNASDDRRTFLLVKLLFIQRLSSENRGSQRELVEQLFGSPFSLHQEVIRAYHDRPSTFMDLKIFLHLLTADEQRALLDFTSSILNDPNVGVHPALVDHCFASSSDESAAAPFSVWTFLLAEMISSFCFQPHTLSDQSLKDSVRRLLSRFLQINANGSDLAIAVHAQMVANNCWEFFLRTDDYNVLALLLSFLEVLNKQTQCNPLIPVLLCRIYAIFGITWRINELVRQMDIKFIQRVNFAFFQCFVAENFGQFRTAGNYYASMVNLQKSNTKEISECIVSAFRKEKYFQIANLYDFMQICQNSVYSQCSVVQMAVFSAFFDSQSVEIASNHLAMDEDDFDLKRTIDNREFSAVKVFLSEATLGEMRDGTLKEIKSYLRLRVTLCRAICSIGKQSLAQNAATFFATLDECRTEYAEVPKIRNMLENFTDTGLEQLFLCIGDPQEQQHEQQKDQSMLVQLPVLVLNAAAIGTPNSAEMQSKQQNDDEQQQEEKQRMIATAKQFATLLNDFLVYFRQQSPTFVTLKGRTFAVRMVAKLIEMVALALIGAKRLERLLPVASLLPTATTTASTKGTDGDGGGGKKEARRSDRKSSNKKQGDRQQHNHHHHHQHGDAQCCQHGPWKQSDEQKQWKANLGPFSGAIHQALQRLRSFVLEKLLIDESSDLTSPRKEAEEEEDDPHGLKQIFLEYLNADFDDAEKAVRENITSTDCFKQIVEAIDHLIYFSCL
ncbi:hypothetical protein niasHT_025919 [Heterodera trifolii]|uniref:N-terminal acetyltransferase B complex subunit MDM20 homolog n=1 Tax=Heterodera trifolii TaxID=157864 RepID=A0ABD2JV08_9BILA